MKVAIYGAGDFGVVFFDELQQFIAPPSLGRERAEVVAVADANKALIGKKLYGTTIVAPERLLDCTFDILYITVDAERFEIYSYLRRLGIPKEKIDFTKNQNVNNNRMDSIRKLDGLYDLQGKEGNIAECGVYQGEMALRLNWFFKSKKLYLFDTFEGFDERDVEAERLFHDKDFLNSMYNKGIAFDKTSDQYVLSRCPLPQNIVMKKGYVPETFSGVDDKFCFVNLDMDLYQPMLEGLKFFWEKLTDNGVMLLHDYYSVHLKGVKKAVIDFEKWLGHPVKKSPVLDRLSLAIFKS